MEKKIQTGSKRTTNRKPVILLKLKSQTMKKSDSENSFDPIDKRLCELIREKEKELEEAHNRTADAKADYETAKAQEQKRMAEFIGKYGIDSATCVNRLLSIYDSVRAGKINAVETFKALQNLHKK